MSQKIVIIQAPQDQPFQIFMIDYYQVFLPLSLLFSSVIIHASDMVMVAVYLLLFSQKPLIALYDLLHFSKYSLRKVFEFVKSR